MWRRLQLPLRPPSRARAERQLQPLTQRPGPGSKQKRQLHRVWSRTGCQSPNWSSPAPPAASHCDPNRAERLMAVEPLQKAQAPLRQLPAKKLRLRAAVGWAEG